MKIKNTQKALLIAALVLSSSAWLNAQTSEAKTDKDDRSASKEQEQALATERTIVGQAGQPMKINRGSVLIGATVKNQQGETLGKIHDIVIDLNTEKVAYAVLDTGTGLLSSKKLHAVPLKAFQPDADGKSLVMNADKQQLAQSEGFDKDNWPSMNTAAWGSGQIYRETQGITKPDRDTTKQNEQKEPKEKNDSEKSKGTEPTPEP